jgi:hypothetical protein
MSSVDPDRRNGKEGASCANALRVKRKMGRITNKRITRRMSRLFEEDIIFSPCMESLWMSILILRLPYLIACNLISKKRHLVQVCCFSVV